MIFISNFITEFIFQDMGAKELKCHVVSINTNSLSQLNSAKNNSTKFFNKIHNLRYPFQLTKKHLNKLLGGGYDYNVCINSFSSAWDYRFHAR
jgi:hypothetical protein